MRATIWGELDYTSLPRRRKDIILDARCRLNKKKPRTLHMADGFFEFARETDFSTARKIHLPETDPYKIRRRCYINFRTHIYFMARITRVYPVKSNVSFINVYFSLNQSLIDIRYVK